MRFLGKTDKKILRNAFFTMILTLFDEQNMNNPLIFY